MKKMMEFFTGFLALGLFVVCNAENLVLTHKPAYVSLDEKASSLRVSDVQHMLSAIHGFTLHKELGFQGLYAHSPFQHPRASAVVALYGGDYITGELSGSKIKVKDDDGYVPTNSVTHHMKNVYPENSNVVEISHDTKGKDLDGILEGLSDMIPMNSLYSSKLFTSNNDSEIVQLRQQASLMLQALERVKANGAGLADFYSFELVVPSTKDAAVAVELKSFVKAVLSQVNAVMSDVYGDDYVLVVLSLPLDTVTHSRKTRSLLATAESDTKDLNLATAYTEDYPVIFHIVLWLVVFMALLTIFVTHGMMSMDPGKDSIIYRMTTTRQKKD